MPAAAQWPPGNDPSASERPAPRSTSVLDDDKEAAAGLEGSEEFPVFVNAGDMLHRWSNGLFKSALHRVSLLEGKDRYSAAFFFDPPWSCVVEPLAAVGAGASAPGSNSDGSAPNPAPLLFPATTYGEYLLAKFRETHASFEAAAGEEVERRRKKGVDEKEKS